MPWRFFRYGPITYAGHSCDYDPRPFTRRLRIDVHSDGSPRYTLGMCRVAISLWLVISTLLGPSLCCCSFAACMAGNSGVESKTPTNSSLPKRHKSCCCQDEPNQRNKDSAPSKAPKTCPCREGRSPASLGQNASEELQVRNCVNWLLSIQPAIDLAFHGLADIGRAGPAHQVQFRRGQDLLSAFQILRC